VRLRRTLAAVAVLATGLVLAGCYGSTEPATNIGFDHATLNGKGTTNSGPAHVYFEYWPTADPAHVVKTAGKDVEGGLTGPVSEPNFLLPFGLTADTQYSFRMCATDRSAPNGVCAQTRTFRTTRPAGDAVHGVFATQLTGIGHAGGVDAQSDASGTNPSGTLDLPGDLGNTFSGQVTCVAVHGSEAAVGAVGTKVDGTPATGLLRVRDGSTASASDAFNYSVTAGTTPPDCAGATFGGLVTPQFILLNVYDTP
jgi:hypothetical protein